MGYRFVSRKQQRTKGRKARTRAGMTRRTGEREKERRKRWIFLVRFVDISVDIVDDVDCPECRRDHLDQLCAQFDQKPDLYALIHDQNYII